MKHNLYRKCYLLIILLILSFSSLHAQLFVYTQGVNPLCNGATNGFAIVNVNGGTAPYTFSWSNGVISSSDTLGNLAAGNYVVTVTDAGSDTIVDSLTLADPPPIEIMYTTNGDTVCDGVGAGVHIIATNISGGPYQYGYTHNGINSPFSFNGNIYLSQPGNYTFTIISNAGCTDTFQLTFAACAGYTGIVEITSNLKLYPNPGIDMFTIDSPVPTERINIYSLDGSLARSIANPANKIDTGMLPAGVYLAEIKIGNERHRVKWVKL